MTKDLKLHVDTVRISYVDESRTVKLSRDGQQRWVIGAEREGDTLNDRHLSFSTTNALHASLCSCAQKGQHAVLVKWRYSAHFDANLLWCELVEKMDVA